MKVHNSIPYEIIGSKSTAEKSHGHFAHFGIWPEKLYLFDEYGTKSTLNIQCVISFYLLGRNTWQLFGND